MPATAPSTRQILVIAAPIAVAVFVFGVSFGVLAIAARIPSARIGSIEVRPVWVYN